jgi:hypothetical protein
VVECFPSKGKAPSSNLSAEREREREREGWSGGAREEGESFEKTSYVHTWACFRCQEKDKRNELVRHRVALQLHLYRLRNLKPSQSWLKASARTCGRLTVLLQAKYSTKMFVK